MDPVRHKNDGLWGADCLEFDTLGSTNNWMLRNLAACRHGDVVQAVRQTAGRGRFNRPWAAPEGRALTLSIALFPSASLPLLPTLVGQAAAVAVRSTLAEFGVPARLKWPNDVLAGGLKCAGILTQLHGDRIVCGIGVNVNQPGFPDELREIATSLRIVAGREFEKEELLEASLGAIGEYGELLREEGRDPILRLFTQSSSWVHGRSVIVDSAGAAIAGTTCGLDESGFLWVRADDGRRHLIRAGGVRAR